MNEDDVKKWIFKAENDFVIDELTDYAINVRYGDEFYFPSVEEAKEALRLAEITRNFVLNAFKKLGVSFDPEKILKEVRDELSQK